MADRVSSSVDKSQNSVTISYLSQREAVEIQDLLTGTLGFSIDQLMELEGLSVAASIAEVYRSSDCSRVLVICGIGNNGGDGLVAARHLCHFGFKPSVCYLDCQPKNPFTGLVTQLESLSIPFLSVEDLPRDLSKEFDIIVDAIFGVLSHGEPRRPFDGIIQRLASLNCHDHTHKRSPAIVSVDIPSGWNVDEGDVGGQGIKPDMLVSLTAPKHCAKKFGGPHHFLGGRFVPPSVAAKYKICVPAFHGTSMCARIEKTSHDDIAAQREKYVSPEFLKDHVMVNPIDKFCKWLEDAVNAGLPQPRNFALSTADKNGKPSSRMLLLRKVDQDGFVWLTNYESRKAREISENPCASLLFFWGGLNQQIWRQVRVEGTVQKTSDEESEKYFHGRPGGSQIAAIVSKQSTVIQAKHLLDQNYEELEAKFSDGSLIPRPENWGGYRLKANLVEFWQGLPSRLHDRFQYSLKEVDGKQVWHVDQLAP
ncbi:pyridoxine/pyridoxamine 5'-phosphate oxidase 1, chloroplastic isoform X1 [Cinnamomum micranthum f. kanehirae]|uniref:NAD(P)H-hydrate epimerase n=1 Tax=Cinnamomum micranthum f. kanehirae TaxID=337451 RepID=A0A3S3MYM9_9MAGN|nr:pyridoxine/pyridoxamine 5'-phosphate oxidase 1, chloroplastic isoform X1 [Cinnamomum micranthum f. kanehirae]